MPRRSGRASVDLTRLVLDTYGRTCWLRLKGCTRTATTKDHVIPVEAGGTDDIENLRPACKHCNSLRRNLSLAEITGVGARVKIVIGPPASGKTTYVQEHAALGDIVVDLDSIARSLLPHQPEHSHVYPPAARHVAIQMRKSAIQQATRLRERCTVWLIHSHPSPDQLAEYAGLHYEITVIDPGQDVVLERCRASRPPAMLRQAHRWYHNPPTLPSAISGTNATPAIASVNSDAAPSRSRSW